MNGSSDAVLLETEPGWCLLCASSEGRSICTDRIIGVANVFNLKRCAHCGLVFLDPRPTSEAVAAYYSPSGGGPRTYAPEFFTFSPELVAVGHKRLERIERILGRRGSLFDFGCGYGEFLTAAHERGWQCAGLEVAPSCLRHLHARLPWVRLYEGDVASLQAEGQRFDVVTLWHLLEHLPDPLTPLARLSQVVAKDGLLVAEVPNIGCERLRFHKRPMHNQLHLWHFPPSCLRLLLERSGWRCVHMRLQDHRAPPHRLQSAVRRAVTGAEQALFRFTGQALGPNLTAYARPISSCAEQRGNPGQPPA